MSASTRGWRRGNKSEHAAWVVNLAFRGWEKPVGVYETKGYRKLERLARKLNASAIDRTGEREAVRSLDGLDRSLAAGGVQPVHESVVSVVGRPHPAVPGLFRSANG